jgi:acyl-CoA thioester hydrolase
VSDRDDVPVRADFPTLRPQSTRWIDDDRYGHVNNVVHHSYVDTAVNGLLIDRLGYDVNELDAIGLVVETTLRYRAPIGFPDLLAVGVAVERMGSSSVVYRTAVFRGDDELPASHGRFVHVYVDATTRRPVAVPDEIRAALAGLELRTGPE